VNVAIPDASVVAVTVPSRTALICGLTGDGFVPRDAVTRTPGEGGPLPSTSVTAGEPKLVSTATELVGWVETVDDRAGKVRTNSPLLSWGYKLKLVLNPSVDPLQ